MPEPSSVQEDFGAGMHRGREAPWNAVYDALNCLIDDEGQLYRRGGCTAYVGSAGTRPTNLGVAELAPGRVALWGEVSGTGLLHGSVNGGAVFTVDGSASFPAVPGRFPQFGDLVAYRRISGSNWLRLYGGSLKTASYAVGTVTVTQYDRIVTGVGTAWLANVDAGMIFALAGSSETTAVVESVDSNTQITLRESWPDASAAGSGYILTPIAVATITSSGLFRPSGPMAVAGRRLLVAVGKRMYFSDIDKPRIFRDANYHQFPYDITGLETLGDVAYVFTPRGVFSVHNLLFDALDDAGNLQHEVRHLNALALWSDSGLARFEGMLVVPCRDDIYLMAGDGSAASISGTDEVPKIRPLWRSYVRTAGYTLGNAAVYDGTYLLPVLNGNSSDAPVTALVCRLDRGAAWTRWTGEAAGRAFAASKEAVYVTSGSTSAIREATPCFAPAASNASDADATTHALDIITRDYRTPGPGKGSTTTGLRARYDAAAAATPAVTASYARGLEGASFTALTLVKGGGTSDGLDHSVWRVNKQAPAIRFRLQSSSPLSSFTLRGIEAPFTRHGLG